LEELPTEFREVIVLRELEGLSYKQIADVAEIPIGTVMSRLARGRKRLQQVLKSHRNKETSEEVLVGGS
jgi:RNA polymerase sigma-70 factor, ECF subfamily